jgi:hypothetical protein
MEKVFGKAPVGNSCLARLGFSGTSFFIPILVKLKMLDFEIPNLVKSQRANRKSKKYGN